MRSRKLRLEDEDVMEVLLLSGQLCRSCIFGLRLTARSLRDTIRRKMPHDIEFELGYGRTKPDPAQRVQALSRAFGGLAIRRLYVYSNFIPVLHLLPHLEELTLTPCYERNTGNRHKSIESFDVSPLAGLYLRELVIDGDTRTQTTVHGLAQLTCLTALYLQDALPGSYNLPSSILEFTAEGYYRNYTGLHPVYHSLWSFNGRLQSLDLRPCVTGDPSPSTLAVLGAFASRQELTHLSFVLCEEHEDPAAMTSLPCLQSAELLILSGQAPRCDFALWPVLQKLVLGIIVDSDSTGWDLTRMAYLHLRFLELNISCESNMHWLTDFAGWGLEAASLTLRSGDYGACVPCKSSHVGRALLGGLWSVLPKELVTDKRAAKILGRSSCSQNALVDQLVSCK